VPEDRDALLERYRQMREELLSAIDGLSEELTRDRRPQPGARGAISSSPSEHSPADNGAGLMAGMPLPAPGQPDQNYRDRGTRCRSSARNTTISTT